MPDSATTSDRESDSLWDRIADVCRLSLLVWLATLVSHTCYRVDLARLNDYDQHGHLLPDVLRQSTFGCYKPSQIAEWAVVVAAATTFGAVGWRYLGGWLVLPQVMGLLLLAGVSLATAFHATWADVTYPDPTPAGVWGGAVAGVIVCVGLACFYRRTPCQPMTLRAMLAGVVVMAVLLGSLQAWWQWYYAERIEWRREQMVRYGLAPEG